MRRTIGAAAVATVLLVAGPATAAHADATVREEGAVIRYEGGGKDSFTVEANAGHVVLRRYDLSGARIAAVTPCTSSDTEASCPSSKPVVADLGDQDDQAWIGSAASGGTFHGGAGDDLLGTKSRRLVALGEEGNDQLVGGPSADGLFGGPGDDYLSARGSAGPVGADELYGGPRDDGAEFVWAEVPLSISLDDVANDGATGDANIHSDIESVVGGQAGDRLTGSDAANELDGRDGADTIEGGRGEDTLDGGEGDDTLLAGDGERDTVDCGGGARDRAVVDPVDVVANCETVEYADNDHDGVTGDRDCDDGDPAVHPGAPEAPGDGIDQDCSGADAPALVREIDRPVPVIVAGPAVERPAATAGPGRVLAAVDDKWTVRRRDTKVARLVVEDVPTGGKVDVLCRGKGCAFTAKAGRVAGGRASLTKLFKGRALKPGAVVEIRVTAPAMVGRSIRFTIRAKKLPLKATS
jgi:hypothetical protein